VAELACPRRSPPPPPRRTASHRQIEQRVELLVTDVLQTRSVALTRTENNISEPASLRRADGSSVYTVAGSELFTSVQILAAEQRLRDRRPHRRTGGGGRNGGAGAAGIRRQRQRLRRWPGCLVRAMCMSAARLQLAIAPAGAGKTTAMSTLARAWNDSGGQVLGLAPSAAAAVQLRDATGTPAETLAKLTWSIHHNELPDWAERIDRSTLVIIDEAGMADTLSLDTAVDFIVRRSGSVRLVGDDQQLAAIGAGGVLRDIQASHGAVRLRSPAGGRCRGCRAFPTGLPPTRTGDHICGPDHSLLLSSPSRSASKPKQTRRPGRLWVTLQCRRT
jgi:AAA domain